LGSTKELKGAQAVPGTSKPLVPFCEGLLRWSSLHAHKPKGRMDMEQCSAEGFWDKVEQRLVPNLAYPVNGKPFRHCTYTSDYAVGAALEQEGEDGLWEPFPVCGSLWEPFPAWS